MMIYVYLFNQFYFLNCYIFIIFSFQNKKVYNVIVAFEKLFVFDSTTTIAIKTKPFIFKFIYISIPNIHNSVNVHVIITYIGNWFGRWIFTHYHHISDIKLYSRNAQRR